MNINLNYFLPREIKDSSDQVKEPETAPPESVEHSSDSHQAALLFKHFEYQKVLDLLNPSLHPLSLNEQLMRVECLYHLKSTANLQEFEKSVNSLLLEFPHEWAALYWKCQLLCFQTSFAEALKILLQLMQSNPQNPKLELLEAQICGLPGIMTKDQLDAKYLNLLTLYPKNSEIVACVFIYYCTKTKKFETFIKGIKSTPHFSEIGIDLLNSALLENPDHPHLNLAKGMFLVLDQDYRNSLDFLRKSFKLNELYDGIVHSFYTLALTMLDSNSNQKFYIEYNQSNLKNVNFFILFMSGVNTYVYLSKIFCKHKQASVELKLEYKGVLDSAINCLKKALEITDYSILYLIIELQEEFGGGASAEDYLKIIEFEPFSNFYYYFYASNLLFKENKKEKAMSLLEQLIVALNNPEHLAAFISHRHFHLPRALYKTYQPDPEKASQEWKIAKLYEVYGMIWQQKHETKKRLEIQKGLEYLQKAFELLPFNLKMSRDLTSPIILWYTFSYVDFLLFEACDSKRPTPIILPQKNSAKALQALQKIESLGPPFVDKYLETIKSCISSVLRGDLVSALTFIRKDIQDICPPNARQIIQKKTSEEKKAFLHFIIAKQRREAEEREMERAKRKLGHSAVKVVVKAPVQEQPVRLLEDKPASEKQPRGPHVLKNAAKQQEILSKLGQKKAHAPKSEPLQVPPAPVVEQPPAPPPVQTTSQSRPRRQLLSEPVEHVLDLRHLQITPVREIKLEDTKKITKASKTERKVSHLSEALAKRLQTAKNWLVFLGDLVARYNDQEVSKFRLNALFSILKIGESLCDTSSGCWQALRLSEIIIETLSVTGRIVDEVQLKINAQLVQILQSLTSAEPQKKDNLGLIHEIHYFLRSISLQMPHYCKINLELRQILRGIPHTNSPLDRLIDEILEELPLQLTLEELKTIDQRLIDIDHLNIIRNEIRSYFLFASNTQLLALAKALCNSSLKDNLQAWIKSDLTAEFLPKLSSVDLPLLCQTDEKKDWDKVLESPNDVTISILFKLMHENFQMIEELIQIKSDFQTFWLQGAEVQSGISMGLSNIRKCLVFFRDHNLLNRFISSDESIANPFNEFISLGNKLGHNIEDVPSESIFEIAKKSKSIGASFQIIQKEQFSNSISLDLSLTAAQLVRLRAHFPKENFKQFRLNLSLLGNMAKKFTKESFIINQMAQEMAKNLLIELKQEIQKITDVTTQHLLNLIFNEAPMDAQKLYGFVLQAKVLMGFLFG